MVMKVLFEPTLQFFKKRSKRWRRLLGERRLCVKYGERSELKGKGREGAVCISSEISIFILVALVMQLQHKSLRMISLLHFAHITPSLHSYHSFTSLISLV